MTFQVKSAEDISKTFNLHNKINTNNKYLKIIPTTSYIIPVAKSMNSNKINNKKNNIQINNNSINPNNNKYNKLTYIIPDRSSPIIGVLVITTDFDIGIQVLVLGYHIHEALHNSSQHLDLVLQFIDFFNK